MSDLCTLRTAKLTTMLRAVRRRCLQASRGGLQCLRQAGTTTHGGVRVQRVTSSPVGTGKVLALRREDNTVWERRAPLSPSHVQRLVKSGVTVIVQPSNRRAFPMQVTRYDYDGCQSVQHSVILTRVETTECRNHRMSN